VTVEASKSVADSSEVLPLHSDHRQDLHKSGLTEDTIRRLQFHAIRPHDLRKFRGVETAYQIPYFSMSGASAGFARLRLFPPITTSDGHTQRYFQPTGSTPHLYFPPLLDWDALARDPEKALIITEGEKKAAKACQEGLSTIGVGGVWNWRVRLDKGEAITLPEVDAFSWSKRAVDIIPDSDAWRAEKMVQVLSGFYALGMELQRRGAHVRIVRLPETPGSKVGLDDWLVKEGSPASEALQRLERMDLADPQLHRIAAWWQPWNSRQQRAAELAHTDLAKAVNGIRLGQLKPFEKKRDIADLAVRDLRNRGRFIRTDEDELLYFDTKAKTLERIVGADFLAALCDRLGLNSTEEETKFVHAEILNQARVHGERAAVHQFAFWDKHKQTLYVWAGNGTIYTCDGTAIKQTDNGTDGVLFKEDPLFEPVVPDLACSEDAFHAAFQFLPVEDLSQPGATLAVLKTWLLSTFFQELLLVRPILTIFGEQNSGKSSTARFLGLLLFGKHFEVGGFRTDKSGESDFLAAITNQRLITYDNADSPAPWLGDHLARAATGAVILRRRYHTTNDLVSYRPRCFIILTSRDPRWNRDDVAKRLLPIRLHSLAQEGNMPEGTLQENILHARPKVFGGLLQILNRAVGAMTSDEQPYRSSHRLADFHRVGASIARAMQVGPLFEWGMENLNQSQLDLLGESDERLDSIRSWTEGFTGGLSEVRLPVGDLFVALKDRFPGAERDFPFRSPNALGSWLARNKELIKSQLGVSVQDDRSHGKRCWIVSSD
jgi:hypothetical protein